MILIKILGMIPREEAIYSWKSVIFDTSNSLFKNTHSNNTLQGNLQIQIFGGKKEVLGLWLIVPPSFFSWLHSLSFHLLIHLKRGSPPVFPIFVTFRLALDLLFLH